MKVYEVSSFTRNDNGGNLAGVVILDSVIDSDKMQQIAKELNYSETAFVEVFEKNIFNVKFFTPIIEVDLCGHASIASFHVLLKNGHIDKEVAIQYTNSGKLRVICKDDLLMEMSSPIVHNDLSKKDCAFLLNIEESIIMNVPKTIEVGLCDAMVVVKDYQSLKNIKIRKDEMINFSNENNITGFHVCTIENGKYYVRNFGPACGIDEESATGTANASMYVYLQKKGYIKGDEKISFLQGDVLNQPSEVIVKKIDETIWVGGKAKIIREFII